MIKLLIIACGLVGCSTVEYVPTYIMPIAPASFLQPCSLLSTLDTATVSSLISITVDNASKYKWCKANNDGLITWYNAQRKIINGDKNEI